MNEAKHATKHAAHDDANNASAPNPHASPRATAGVVIRSCEPSDMAALAAIMNLPGVRRDTLMLGYRTPESLSAWAAKLHEGSVHVCAELDGRMVGHASLTTEAGRRAHCAALGVAVHDACQGRGVGSALLHALTRYADGVLALRRIELTVYTVNLRAIALYRRFGFVEEGRSRGYAMRDGVLADVLHMARLADAPPFSGS